MTMLKCTQHAHTMACHVGPGFFVVWMAITVMFAVLMVAVMASR